MKSEVRTLSILPTDLVAELTSVAYGVALRHMPGGAWLDLQLDLWHELTIAAGKWNIEAHRGELRYTDSMPASDRPIMLGNSVIPHMA
jgi:hypothetical protein